MNCVGFVSQSLECFVLFLPPVLFFWSILASVRATASLHCWENPLRFFRIIYHLILLENYFLFKLHTVLFVSWGSLDIQVPFP